jgi:hypothetical protein
MIAAQELSIVIASVSGWEPLSRCLSALREHEADDAPEIVVVMHAGSDAGDPLIREHPAVTRILVPGGGGIPALRAAGIDAASGRIVALTEDHCIPAAGWCRALLRSHRAHDAAAIGGVVENAATERLVDWAVYFCEYGRFAGPRPEGPTTDLSAPNVSYKRDRLPALDGEYWETFVHGHLRNAGETLWFEPRMRVHHCMHFGFAGFLAERYHYGRAFAGRRVTAFSWPRRLAYAALSPLLVPLFIVRTLLGMRRQTQHWPRLALCLPMIVAFAAAAAAGEAAGYLTGGGTSVTRLR